MKKRSITIAGHRTSVALEPEFWALIEKMAAEQSLSLADFIASIDPRTRGCKSGFVIAIGGTELATANYRPCVNSTAILPIDLGRLSNPRALVLLSTKRSDRNR